MYSDVSASENPLRIHSVCEVPLYTALCLRFLSVGCASNIIRTYTFTLGAIILNADPWKTN